MAKQKKKGLFKNRSQFKNPLNRLFVKRNTTNGRLMDVKEDGKPFKRVRRER